MSPLRRKTILVPLAGISLVLLLVPAAVSRKVRLAGLALFRPIKGVAHATMALPGSVLSSPGSSELQTQNEYYKDQVQKLLNENAKLKDQLNLASTLKQAFPDQNFRVLHADVLLPTDASPWRKSLTLSAGSKAGVQRGMLVLYNNQLVGRILEVSPWTSLVQLVTDPAFKAGAVAVPKTTVAGVSFDKRRIGVYEGTSGPKGQLKWLMGDTASDPDGFVVTTEDPPNGVPRGLLLGRIAGVLNAASRSPRIEVEPVVDFRALEHVMILISDSK
jgi:rod shape-determining protein MreC